MKIIFRLKGGIGSGFHGHSGRPGLVGGSSPDHREKFISDLQSLVDRKIFTEKHASALMEGYDNFVSAVGEPIELPAEFEKWVGSRLNNPYASPEANELTRRIQEFASSHEIPNVRLYRSVYGDYAKDLLTKNENDHVVLDRLTPFSGVEAVSEIFSAAYGMSQGYTSTASECMIVFDTSTYTKGTFVGGVASEVVIPEGTILKISAKTDKYLYVKDITQDEI